MNNEENTTPLRGYYTNPEAKILIQEAIAKSDEKYGRTPLHRCYTPALIRQLIEEGADVNSRSKYGQTPLHGAYADKAEILIEAGADINVKDENGSTPLHYAISRNTAQVLIDAGADISARNNEGKTPSETAGDEEVIALIESELLKRANEKIIKEALKPQEARKEQAHRQRF